jgi:hypothetical protein
MVEYRKRKKRTIVIDRSDNALVLKMYPQKRYDEVKNTL